MNASPSLAAAKKRFLLYAKTFGSHSRYFSSATRTILRQRYAIAMVARFWEAFDAFSVDGSRDATSTLKTLLIEASCRQVPDVGQHERIWIYHSR
jgi:hypothetical protein